MAGGDLTAGTGITQRYRNWWLMLAVGLSLDWGCQSQPRLPHRAVASG